MAAQSILDWQNKLRPINEAKRDSVNPRVDARYKGEDSKTFFYPVEAEYVGQGYVYWGFAVLPQRKFPITMQISSYELESGKWMGGVPCSVDSSFVPGYWKDVKSEHYESPPDLFLGRIKRETRKKPTKGGSD